MTFGSYHINSVKQGREYFHVLRQEALEKNNTLQADQQAPGPRWTPKSQLPKYSPDVGESEAEINL